jgi:hypothetical protein
VAFIVIVVVKFVELKKGKYLIISLKSNNNYIMKTSSFPCFGFCLLPLHLFIVYEMAPVDVNPVGNPGFWKNKNKKLSMGSRFMSFDAIFKK